MWKNAISSHNVLLTENMVLEYSLALVLGKHGFGVFSCSGILGEDGREVQDGGLRLHR